VVAVVVTAASGYDLGYVWKNQASRAEPERSAGGYYINAAQAGEPPGRWWGPGAQALGFTPGQEVERGPYELVYRQIDPQTGQKLGRSPGCYAKFNDHLARLTAAEPHATTERLLELEREAAQATRQSPAYTDLTVSFSKSISVFHASIRENERRARLSGNHAEAARWADAERRYQEVLHAANRAGLEYVQQWAGITRTGYHGTRVGDQEPGRFEEGQLTVTSWLQGTSRDGDPQDHIHNQIARMVQTVSDGKWRALDTVCLRQVLGAVQAITATHAECGLTREFGVAWVPRLDGAGNEIAGITQAEMDAYSSRTVAITGKLPAAVESWTAKYGREPNQRELLYIRQEVTLASRDGKDAGVIDWDAMTARWDTLIGGALASVAPRVSALRAGAHAAPASRNDADAHATPSRAELTRAVRRALTLTQASRSTWTRSDFLKQLALVLPAHTRNLAPTDAVALLHRLAGEALAGSVEQVACLEAPQWPPLPSFLRRDTDGRSVYTRPGGARYATRIQLSMEERLLADAQRSGAPHLTRSQAGVLLGADPADLDARLHQRANAGGPALAESGLRLDQGAALFHALTSDRTVEVITGPAGSGKTRLLVQAARAWTCAGLGEVVGIAAAQAARNVLTEAGVPVAVNSAAFLGHLPGRRGALGIRDIGSGTLLLIDEASMMSMPDLADIIGHAARRGAKVLVAGDQEQLAAVESGGGMMLLARRLGYVQLAEAVRFTARWERDASLRLRTGDVSALEEYREHGRIRGADPEQALDDAVRRYVAHTLAGRDVLLMIADRERCREVSRRIREELIHFGVVSAGADVRLAGGARASVGDLIICRRNDHQVEAGEPGRTLANGDTLRIEAIGPDRAILVRRALDCDPATGERRWTERAFSYAGYGGDDLAYAVTGHSAQGRTVQVGLPVLTGTEDRQWAYVAMTRGAQANVMTVFTQPGRIAEPEAGTRPAPELARHDRVMRERVGLPAVPSEVDAGLVGRDAVAVAADILNRDGSDASALETHARALADADHLAVLNAIWNGETAGLRAERYRAMVLDALPAQYAADGLTSPQATWLWRTLRAAEAAGLDAGQVVREVIGARSLAGSRDVAAVVDSRLRRVVDSLVPLPARPWSEQVPAVANPERQRFLADLAAAMDARKERIGEHLSEHPPAWAGRVLGPVPDDPLDRLEWQRRAAEIGAYRELHGYGHPDEPIGPEPTGDSPEKRAAWHGAFAALGPADGVDLRGLPDGSLVHMRGTYETETAWAPRHVGRELRQIRASSDDAELAAIRAAAEERVARERGLDVVAGRHGALGRSWTAMAAFYRAQEAELEQTMEARRDWERATEETRRLAVAADSELRRRHPGQRLEPLRSAEPVGAEEERGQLVVAVGAESYETPEWITRLAAERQVVREQLDERKAVLVPSEDPDHGYEGEAWPTWRQPDRDAILQPPRPEMRPAPEIAERFVEYEAEHG
jgi:hypothetical protein